MKCYIFFLLSSLFIPVQLHAQNISLDWVDGAKYHTILGKQNMALSPQNDVYTAGYFENTVNFEPNTTDYVLTSNGQRDGFIKKVNSNGDLLWVKQIESISSNQAELINVDENGDLYIIGHYNGTTDFDTGSGIHQITAIGNSNVFVLKLDANGDFLWVKSFEYFEIQSAVVDHLNNLYILGSFSLVLDLDPGTGTQILQPDHAYDYFIQKLDAQGNYVWTSHIASTDVKAARYLAIDSSSYLYTTGFFKGTIDFDPGPTVSNLTSNGNVKSMFIQKLDLHGNFVWAKTIGNASNTAGIRVATDQLNGVYISGTFSDTLSFNSNLTDNIVSNGGVSSYILKLDTEGNFEWAVSLPTNGQYRITSIQTDLFGSIYLSGFLSGIEVDFDPGPLEDNLPVINGDMFIHKFDLNGAYKWAIRIGDTENGWDASFCSIIDPSGSLYFEMLAGAGGDIIDFAPGPTLHNVSTTYEEQMYLVKLSACYLETVDHQNACGTYTWMDGITYTTSNNTATYTVTNTFGCDSIITLDLEILPIDLSVLTLGQFIGANQTGASYQWLNCDDNYSIIPGETQSTFTSNTYGNFAVELTYNGCIDTSACTTINTIGTKDIDLISEVIISPNPTSNHVYINFGHLQNKNFKVINALGQIVDQRTNIVESIYTYNLNQPSGIYTFEVYTDKIRNVFKLVKQ